MLEFVSRPLQFPETRPADERRQDYQEITETYTPPEAEKQAERCSQCGIPYCQIHCPLENNIPDWLMLTAEGRLEEAWLTSQETNAFPEVCGRICPQDRLCEGNCVIEAAGHGTVAIGPIEIFLTETAFREGWVRPIQPKQQHAQSIGIIGAGPAGLAAAVRLREAGYAVHVYDAYDRIGGLMIYGIPNFKLEKAVVERRAQWLLASGVQFHLNCRIGQDMPFAELRTKHDAVLIATGCYDARDIELEVLDAQGQSQGKVSGNAPDWHGTSMLTPALAYLTAANREGLQALDTQDAQAIIPEGDALLRAEGQDVVVIGGGDTAMDCVRTAIRQGAKSVTCLYRRDRANMPGSAREVEKAGEEGVHFRWLSAPHALRIDGKNQLVGLDVQGMELGPADASGRRSVSETAGDRKTLKADRVILALGYDPEDLPTLWDAADLAVTRWKTPITGADARKPLETALEGVFAAGDIYRGASLVVWAIKDGMQAAQEIIAYIEQARTSKTTADAA